MLPICELHGGFHREGDINLLKCDLMILVKRGVDLNGRSTPKDRFSLFCRMHAFYGSS